MGSQLGRSLAEAVEAAGRATRHRPQPLEGDAPARSLEREPDFGGRPALGSSVARARSTARPPTLIPLR
jgi:hypothetical protein